MSSQREEVRDHRNMIIGFISDVGDKRVATHMKKGYAGYYNKNSNITLDNRGRIFAYGDATQSLIRNMEYEGR